ncbi:MAG: cell division protein ZapA [Proteobacteria bacterium]|nr:cell division protein ZapA [Pseudomonadota bacterium]
MSKELDVQVGGRAYRVAVEEGQESRVKSIAKHYDDIVSRLRNSPGGGQIDRDRLLVLSGLMLADEYFSLRDKFETDTKALTAFQNSMAERLEHLMGKLQQN